MQLIGSIEEDADSLKKLLPHECGSITPTQFYDGVTLGPMNVRLFSLVFSATELPTSLLRSESVAACQLTCRLHLRRLLSLSPRLKTFDLVTTFLTSQSQICVPGRLFAAKDLCPHA